MDDSRNNQADKVYNIASYIAAYITVTYFASLATE